MTTVPGAFAAGAGARTFAAAMYLPGGTSTADHVKACTDTETFVTSVRETSGTSETAGPASPEPPWLAARESSVVTVSVIDMLARAGDACQRKVVGSHVVPLSVLRNWNGVDVVPPVGDAAGSEEVDVKDDENGGVDNEDGGRGLT